MIGLAPLTRRSVAGLTLAGLLLAAGAVVAQQAGGGDDAAAGVQAPRALRNLQRVALARGHDARAVAENRTVGHDAGRGEEGAVLNEQHL